MSRQPHYDHDRSSSTRESRKRKDEDSYDDDYYSSYSGSEGAETSDVMWARSQSTPQSSRLSASPSPAKIKTESESSRTSTTPQRPHRQRRKRRPSPPRTPTPKNFPTTRTQLKSPTTSHSSYSSSVKSCRSSLSRKSHQAPPTPEKYDYDRARRDVASFEGLLAMMRSGSDHMSIFGSDEIRYVEQKLERAVRHMKEAEDRISQLEQIQSTLEMRKETLEQANAMFDVLTDHPDVLEYVTKKQKQLTQAYMQLKSMNPQ